MNKVQVINEIHEAKRAHISWVSRAQALIMGLPLEQNQVPMHSTDCKFGKWYYGHGQVLHALPAFKAIEEPHMQLHETYMKIFKLLFGEQQEAKSSFWDKLFGKSATIDNEANKAEAEELFKVLKGYSDQVVGQLDALEDQLQGVDEALLQGA